MVYLNEQNFIMTLPEKRSRFNETTWQKSYNRMRMKVWYWNHGEFKLTRSLNLLGRSKLRQTKFETENMNE